MSIFKLCLIIASKYKKKLELEKNDKCDNANEMQLCEWKEIGIT